MTANMNPDSAGAHSLSQAVVLELLRTGNRLSSLGEELFRRFSLTAAQFNVLAVLEYVEGPLTQSDLSEELVVTRASVTSVIDRLESKGLVRRLAVPGNRRIRHVELTDEGVATFRNVEPHYREALSRALAGLTTEQKETCLALMRTLREQLETREA
jgi:MarR family 2-MHQ and catechol resistance regulon transcriptional repressor